MATAGAPDGIDGRGPADSPLETVRDVELPERVDRLADAYDRQFDDRDCLQRGVGRAAAVNPVGCACRRHLSALLCARLGRQLIPLVDRIGTGTHEQPVLARLIRSVVPI